MNGEKILLSYRKLAGFITTLRVEHFAQRGFEFFLLLNIAHARTKCKGINFSNSRSTRNVGGSFLFLVIVI